MWLLIITGIKVLCPFQRSYICVGGMRCACELYNSISLNISVSQVLQSTAMYNSLPPAAGGAAWHDNAIALSSHLPPPTCNITGSCQWFCGWIKPYWNNNIWTSLHKNTALNLAKNIIWLKEIPAWQLSYWDAVIKMVLTNYIDALNIWAIWFIQIGKYRVTEITSDVHASSRSTGYHPEIME